MDLSEPTLTTLRRTWRESLGWKLYWIWIVLLSFSLTDLMAHVLFMFGNLKFYSIDVLYVLLVAAFVLYLRKMWYQEKMKPELFLLFLSYLALRALLSIPVFGMSAVGEFRYFLPVFGVFVPLVLFDGKADNHQIAQVIIATVFVSGIVSFVLLGLELMYGGRFFFASENAGLTRMEDFRGSRFLGSEETVNLSLMVCALTFLSPLTKRKRGVIFLLGMTFLAVVVTRNRTAPFAVFSGLALLLLLLGRFRLLVRAFGSLALILFLVALLAPTAMNQALAAFESLLDIGSDDTGRWRVLIQIAALEEAFRNPLFGEGLGGYFSLQVPELESLVEEPPHSAYIHLFWKAGIIAPILVFSAMIVLVFRSVRMLRRYYNDGNSLEAVAFEICMVMILAQFLYGLAYGFSLFFGLYSGFTIALLRASERNGDSSVVSGATR